MRIRFFGSFVSSVMLFIALLPAGTQAAPKQTYYLALGDSLAVGLQPTPGGGDVSTNQGYADDLYALLRLRTPGLLLEKLGCSGETTMSMVNGGPCSYAQGNQLDAAVAFIQTHNVSLITLDIGANDVDGCVSLTTGLIQTCVTTGLGNIGSYLPVVVSALRTVAPATPIIAMNYYDPFLAAEKLGAAGQIIAADSLLATNVFNNELESVYQPAGIPVADVATAFRINDAANVPILNVPLNVFLELTYTWIDAPPPFEPDIHPNAVGYAVIAGAFAGKIAKP